MVSRKRSELVNHERAPELFTSGCRAAVVIEPVSANSLRKTGIFRE